MIDSGKGPATAGRELGTRCKQPTPRGPTADTRHPQEGSPAFLTREQGRMVYKAFGGGGKLDPALLPFHRNTRG